LTHSLKRPWQTKYTGQLTMNRIRRFVNKKAWGLIAPVKFLLIFSVDKAASADII
jgi:hypothetical protein